LGGERRLGGLDDARSQRVSILRVHRFTTKPAVNP